MKIRCWGRFLAFFSKPLSLSTRIVLYCIWWWHCIIIALITHHNNGSFVQTRYRIEIKNISLHNIQLLKSARTVILLIFRGYTLSSNPPSLGKTMRYSALHCGQATRAVLLPRCFSSTQRCRQAWWTHLVEPRQRHGRTHSAVRSSSSVAKHTQQLLKTNKQWITGLCGQIFS